MLGNKKIARSTMIAAGVPVVPGSEGDVEDIETCLLYTSPGENVPEKNPRGDHSTQTSVSACGLY